VRRLHLALLVLAFWSSLHAGSAWACRYNVLEVGFIDLGIEPYHLLGYVDESTPASLVSTLEDQATIALVDTNVQFELVRVGRDPNHPALEYLSEHQIAEFPAAVLVSPDRQSRAIPLAGPQDSFVARFSTAMEGILASPKRTDILTKTAGTYGVVFLIEGPNEAENDIARIAAQAAVSEVAAQMQFMPKPIANPPEVVTLKAESLRDEEVLLWSLDLKPEDVNVPCAVVIYSRGRWIGPLFRGEQITQEHLERILFVIGADCECGLDHRWLQGTMLPLRWDQTFQEATAKSLGLDPESPMVKMEMISIIRRGMGGFSAPGVPFGYREVEVGSEVATPIEFVEEDEEVDPPETTAESVAPAEPTEPDEPAETTEPAPSKHHEDVPPIPEGVVPTHGRSSPAAETVDAEDPTAAPILGLVLVGLAVCVIGVGVMVFMRSKKS